MASLSDLEEKLRESEANSARLRAEIAARKAEGPPPPSDEDDLVNEGINFADGTRDGDDDERERWSISAQVPDHHKHWPVIRA